MRSSPLYADGKSYCLTQDGRLYILKPDESKGVSVVSRGRLPRGESCDAAPICSHGRVYITTSGGIYCLVDSEKTHAIAAAPPAAEETPRRDDDGVAHVQLTPADSLIYPGQAIDFRVRLYNDRGQFLRESPAEFTLRGPGKISADGRFIAPSDAGHVATIVQAKVGDVTGTARIRIVPPLPWEFTFDDLDDAPVTWVGARYRHVVRDQDGNKVLVKVTTIPKGTRSRCWFGHPELKNYTIQADVLGRKQNDKMPDIGLIAQGYTIDLQGANQQLQIRSWVPQLRMAKTIPFSWEPDRWYTIKLQASIEGDRAVLRGKVWPRGETEPPKWQVTAIDESPNRSGSPGLFGNAKDAEIWIDHVKVYPNQ